MGSLRRRQKGHQEAAAAARRRLRQSADQIGFMTPAVAMQDYQDQIAANWSGGPTVLAFLFAQPDSAAIKMLDSRGEYFDVRTGETWDLFFPGYYRSDDPRTENRARSRSVGTQYAANWYFSPQDFDRLRKHVEQSSQRRWRYSGGADPVLVNGMLVDDGDPVVDWVSTQGWDILDATPGGLGLTLAKVIESITHDFDTHGEDESYGLRREEAGRSSSDRGRDFMIDTVRDIAVALGLKLVGL